jgi:antitoxin VapB
MAITRVFQSGNSQAVRIPKRFRLRSSRVEITKRGNEIILRETPTTLAPAVDLLKGLSDDFSSSTSQGRDQRPSRALPGCTPAMPACPS